MMKLFKKKKTVFVKPTLINSKYFEVQGAGCIEISDCDTFRCGTDHDGNWHTGFHFGVEWGNYGFAGGVLPRAEARKLAEHILKVLGDDDPKKYPECIGDGKFWVKPNMKETPV